MGRSSTLGSSISCKSEQSILDDEYDESLKDDCPDCGGHREWCDSCKMWTQICCKEFGTCECS